MENHTAFPPDAQEKPPACFCRYVYSARKTVFWISDTKRRPVLPLFAGSLSHTSVGPFAQAVKHQHEHGKDAEMIHEKQDRRLCKIKEYEGSARNRYDGI